MKTAPVSFTGSRNFYNPKSINKNPGSIRQLGCGLPNVEKEFKTPGEIIKTWIKKNWEALGKKLLNL